MKFCPFWLQTAIIGYWILAAAFPAAGQNRTVSGPVAANETWGPNETVRVESDTTILNGVTLTILEGTRIEFAANSADLTAEGTIRAEGAAGNPVVFTAVDAEQGWGGLVIAGKGTEENSIFRHAVFENGGTNYFSAARDAMVRVNGTSPRFESCIFRSSRSHGARLAGSDAVFDSCEFTGNADEALAMDVDSSPLAENTTASGNAFDGLLIEGGTLVRDRIWRLASLPYRAHDDITLPATYELTIEAGNTIEFRTDSADLIAEGVLTAAGTEERPIAFTSAGDNADNRWGGIVLRGERSGGSLLEHCEFRHGGSNYFSAAGAAMISVESATPALRNCLADSSRSDGLRLTRSNAVLDSVRFNANAGSAVLMNPLSFPVLDNVSASGNGFDAVRISGGTIVGSGRWDYSEIPYLIAEDIRLPTSVELTIDPGNTVQFQTDSADLTVEGTLTAIGTPEEAIHFTSLRDDPGTRWGGLVFSNPEANGSALEHCEFRYGGSNFFSAAGSAMIRCVNASPMIVQCRVGHSNSNGLAMAGSNATVFASLFENNADSAVFMDTASFPAFENIGASGNGNDTVTIGSGILARSGRWDFAEIPYLAAGDITIPTPAVLTIDPGTEVRFGADSADLIAQGALTAIGTPEAPIRFTSSSGGADTRWGGIVVQGQDATDSLLQWCEISHGGSNYFSAAGGAMVAVSQSSPSILDCRILASKSDGIDLFLSNAILERNRIESGANHAIRMDVASFPLFDGNAADGNAFDTITIRSGEMTESGRWDPADMDYNLEGDVTVAESVHLTIDAGNTVRFQTSSTDLIVRGGLEAPGTADAPVRFTNLGDERYGGVYFGPTLDSGNTILSYCVFENGGSNYFSATRGSMVYCDQSSPVFLRCVFQHSRSDGLWIADGEPLLDAPRFIANAGRAAQLFPGAFPAIANAEAAGNGANGIHIAGGEWNASGVWGNPGIPYRIGDDVVIGREAEIILAAGNTVEMTEAFSDLIALGTLRLPGTPGEPILFVSGRFPASPGDWGSVTYSEGSMGQISHTQFENGGSNYFSSGKAGQLRIGAAAAVTVENALASNSRNHGLVLESTQTIVQNSDFIDNREDGLRVQGAGRAVIDGCEFGNNNRGLAAAGSGEAAVIHSVFRDNSVGLATEGDAARIEFGGNRFVSNAKTGGVNFRTAASSRPGNQVNGDGAGLEIEGGELTESGGLHPLLGGHYLVQRGLTVAPQGELTVHPGARIAMNGSNALITVNGTLLARGAPAQPVTVTAPPGVADATAAGVYTGLRAIGSGRLEMSNAIIRNGGARGAAVDIGENAFGALEYVRFEHNATALGVSGNAELSAAFCSFAQNGLAISANGEPGMDAAVRFSQVAGNQAGAQNRAPDVEIDATFNWWGTADGPSGAGPGSGDTVSGGVRYDPWFQSAGQVPTQPLTPTVMEIGGSASRGISQFDMHLYRVSADAGLNLLCSLEDGAAQNRYHIYWAYGYAPNAARFDRSVEGPRLRPAHELLVPNTQGGDYYFLVFAAEIDPTPANYTIRFSAVDEYVTALSPDAAGDRGVSTLALEGSDFTPDVQIRLTGPRGETIAAGPGTIDPAGGLLYAQADFRPAEPGFYGLEAEWPERSVVQRFANAFEVRAGIGPRLETALEPPNLARPGRVYTVFLRYENTGDSDLGAPVFVVKSDPPVPLSLKPDGPFDGESLVLLGIPGEGPAGSVRPGGGNTIPVYFRAEGSGTISFSLEALTSIDEIIEWAAPQWPRFAEAVGSLWGDYQTALRDLANSLWLDGVRVIDARELIARVLDEIGEAPGGEIHGRILDDSNGHPQAGAVAVFRGATGNLAFEAQADSSGAFDITGLPAGDYTIEAEGYAWVEPASVTLGEGEILSGLELRVPYGGLIEGTAFEMPDRTPMPNAVVLLTDEAGLERVTVTDENGAYGFRAVPPGEYQLQASSENFAPTVHEGISMWRGRTLSEADFLLFPGVPLSGSVLGDADSSPVPYPAVTALDERGRIWTAAANEDGQFRFTQLSAGDYTLTADASGHRIAEMKIELTEEGLTGLEIRLSEAARPSGVVVDANGNPIPNAFVTAWSAADGSSGNAFAEADGAFELSLNPGLHYAWAGAPGYAVSQTMVELPAGGEPPALRFELAPTVTIRGTVETASGSPPETETIVMAESANGSPLGVTVTEGGAFALEQIPAGTVRVTALHESHTFPEAVLDVSGDRDDVTIRAADGIIQGAISADGAPATDAQVIAHPTGEGADGRQPLGAAADENGNFILESLLPGEYLVAAHADGFAYETQSVSVGDAPARVDFALQPELPAGGTIRSELTGAPVRALVVFRTGPEDPGVQVFSKENGHYGMSGLAPGAYEVAVRSEGYPLYIDSNVEVTDATAAQQLDFAISPDGVALTGMVVDEETSLPLPDAILRFSAGGLDAGRFETGNRGEYRAGPFAPGTYEVQAIFGSNAQTYSVTIDEEGQVQHRDFALALESAAGFPENLEFAAKAGRFAVKSMGKNQPADIVDWFVPERHYPYGFEDYYTEHPDMPRDSRINNVVDYLDGTALAWELRGLDPFAICRGPAMDIFRLLEKSEEVYKDAWNAQGNSDVTWYAGTGEYVGRGIEGVGKAAELFLSVKAVMASTALSLGKAQSLLEFDLKTIKDALGLVKDVLARFRTGYAAMNGRLSFRKALEEVWWGLGKVVGSKRFVNALKEIEEFAGAAPWLKPAHTFLDMVYKFYKTYESYQDVQQNIRTNQQAANGRYYHYQLLAARVQAAFQRYQKCEEDPPPFPIPPTQVVRTANTPVIVSRDPNEKTGPGGFEGTVTADGRLVYTVFFENAPDATASAQQVVITDDLENTLDWDTHRPVEAAFGDRVIPFPDNRPDGFQSVPLGNYAVEIEATVNPFTGRARWTLTLIDPETGTLPLDAAAGFLPPNDKATGSGEGHVTFSILPKPGLEPGTRILNQADIVFDVNDPIRTNQTVHTVGGLPPARPIALSPAGGLGTDSMAPWLSASGYQHPAGVPHARSEFEIRELPLSAIVWLAETDTPETGIAPIDSELVPERRYQWRVRYETAEGVWSDWSEPAAFTVFPEGGLDGRPDANGDGRVDTADLLIILEHWNGAAPGDLNGDGTVGWGDLYRFAPMWRDK